jgi:NAD(P)H-flavin reductase
MMTLPISRQAMLWEITAETFRVKSFLLHVAGCQGHLSGQHADIRLTAEDDYQAQRSYSIALPPDGELLALTVARVEDVEVSPYLPAEVSAGGRFDLRGPMGGYFVWTVTARSALSYRGWIGRCTSHADVPASRHDRACAPAKRTDAVARAVEIVQ